MRKKGFVALFLVSLLVLGSATFTLAETWCNDYAGCSGGAGCREILGMINCVITCQDGSRANCDWPMV